MQLDFKKEDGKKKVNFQFQMNSTEEKRLDRLYKAFIDEYGSKAGVMRALINKAYEQNFDNKKRD